MTDMTGGEAIVDALIANDVKTIYGLPGVQNDFLYNALYDARDKIHVVHTRHEQGAGYMALGAALATGKTSVCNIVPGPGILNAGAALANAYGLNAPVVLLTGHIPLADIGRHAGALHEIKDQTGLLRGLTKHVVRVEHPSEAHAGINEAFRVVASGRPRPVAVEVPMDVLAQKAPVTPSAPQAATWPEVDTNILQTLAEAIGKARHPMLFVGSGAQDVAPLVRRLSELLQAPVVGYRTGRGIMDSDDPLSLTLPAGRALWADTDLVLTIGSHARVPLTKWGWKGDKKLARIDVDPSTHALIRKADIALTARAEEALPQLIAILEQGGYKATPRGEAVAAAKQEWIERSAVLEPQISYLRVIRDALGPDGIFVDELTQIGFASRIVGAVHQPRTQLSTGYMGTLGWGFPTALGAKHACPDRRVISVAGDGGFMFASNELATAMQHNIALVTIVFNNNQYGNVQQMQRELYGNRVIATDLVNPDFVKFAESFGAFAARVDSPAGLVGALEAAFASGRPAIIEVEVGDMISVDRFR